MLGGPRLVVALDAEGVCGVQVGRRFGRAQVRSFARSTLAPGALVPGPYEPNLARRGEVLAALGRIHRELGTGRRATLILPDGVARVALVSGDGELEARELARFRLGPRLPFPLEQAVVDGLPVGSGKVLAGAARLPVVAEYESVAEEAGFEPERVELAPLTAVCGLIRGRPSGERGLDVVLGDVAFGLVVRDGGTLASYRSRRLGAGPGAWARLALELDREARLAGTGASPMVRVVGPGATEAAAALAAVGYRASPGWPGVAGPAELAQAAWLGGVA
jgi:hypothetical protein